MKCLFDNLRKYIPLMIQCFFSYSLNVTCEAENFEKFLKKNHVYSCSLFARHLKLSEMWNSHEINQHFFQGQSLHNMGGKK